MANCVICGRSAGFLVEVCDSCKEKRSPGSSGKPGAKVQLSSIGLIREAASQIYRHRAVLLLAAAVPILCSLAMWLTCKAYVCAADDEPNLTSFYLFSFARMPFYVMFATVCHRVVLLGDSSLSRRWGLFWSIREAKFLGWLCVLGVFVLVVSFPISYLYGFLIPRMSDRVFELLVLHSPISISFYICVLASTYVDGRFGLILPATAVGRPTSPLRSWRFTAGNGWSIFVALLIPILLTDVVDFIVFDWLLKTESMILDILSSLIYYPLIAVGVVVITIAYRVLELAQNSESTEHPSIGRM